MSANTAQPPPPNAARFNQLMQEGQAAAKRGERRLAHDLYREAAVLDPYSEQVWLALLDVLTNDEDRRVCLQNIVAINPLNVQARRGLHALDAKAERHKAIAERKKVLAQKRAERLEREKRQRRRRLITTLILGVLGAALTGVLLSVIVYGMGVL